MLQSVTRLVLVELRIMREARVGKVIEGTEGDDVPEGGAGPDVLRGHGGADTLRGGSGDDRLGVERGTLHVPDFPVRAADR